MLSPLERMRRERRWALLFFNGLLFLSALLHLLGFIWPPTGTGSSSPGAPSSVTENAP